MLVATGQREVIMHESEVFVRTASEPEAEGLTGLGIVAAAAAIRNGDIWDAAIDRLNDRRCSIEI